MKIYHGTVQSGIEELIPQCRHTPGSDSKKIEAIYATDLPAIAAAHSFPWVTSEGVSISIDEQGKVELQVPSKLLERLKQEVYIYEIEDKGFVEVEDVLGHNFRTTESVRVIGVQIFKSVEEAINELGGTLVIKD